MWEAKLGGRAAELYLACWLARGRTESQVQHKRNPSLAEVRAFAATAEGVAA